SGAVRRESSVGGWLALVAAFGATAESPSGPAVAARAGITWSDFCEIRSGALHAARSDSGGYRRRIGAVAGPRRAVSVGSGGGMHRGRVGRAAIAIVRAVRGGSGGLGVNCPGAFRRAPRRARGGGKSLASGDAKSDR